MISVTVASVVSTVDAPVADSTSAAVPALTFCATQSEA
jgi:hypothetical protein